MIYLIASLMRTGSSLLCDLLTKTGLVGMPTEWGNKWVLKQFGIDEPGCFPLRADYIQQMINKYPSNGFWGMKCPSHTYREWIERGELESFFPVVHRYIYLTRQDHVAQAVSAVKAGEKDHWFSDQKWEARTNTPVYARWKIKHFVNRFEQDETIWEAYFTRMKVEPLRLTYEGLTADTLGTIVKVLNYLGADVPDGFTLPESDLVKQADETSAEWIRRYQEGE